LLELSVAERQGFLYACGLNNHYRQKKWKKVVLTKNKHFARMPQYQSRSLDKKG
jgi:hypothetical protein